MRPEFEYFEVMNDKDQWVSIPINVNMVLTVSEAMIPGTMVDPLTQKPMMSKGAILDCGLKGFLVKNTREEVLKKLSGLVEPKPPIELIPHPPL